MSKYGNVSTYMFGICFRSKAEATHALWLESELQANKILEWIYEKRYLLEVNGSLVATHKPDFTIVLKDGREVVHEVKGGRATMTEAWALRRNLFEAIYPHIKYEVFANWESRRRRYIWGL